LKFGSQQGSVLVLLKDSSTLTSTQESFKQKQSSIPLQRGFQQHQKWLLTTLKVPQMRVKPNPKQAQRQKQNPKHKQKGITHTRIFSVLKLDYTATFISQKTTSKIIGEPRRSPSVTIGGVNQDIKA